MLGRVVVRTLLATILSCPVARAQSLDPYTWGTDGPVNAIASANGVVYVGGDFHYVGPNVDQLAMLDANTGALRPGMPAIDGAIKHILPDGTGGWFLQGDFNTIGSAPRKYLAHMLADGSLTPLSISPNDAVTAIARLGNTLYLGGSFSMLNGQPRYGLAAIDATTGALTDWSPRAAGSLEGFPGPPSIHAMTAYGSTIYVGGSFTSMNFIGRRGLAGIDATTGQLTSWNPSLDHAPYCFTLDGSRLFVGGAFTSIGNFWGRAHIASFDLASGALQAWGPPIDGPVNAIAVGSGVVYAGGKFSTAGDVPRQNIAALDANVFNHALDWNPGADDQVYVMQLSGSSLILGGSFKTVGGQPRTYVAAVDAATGAPQPWDGRVRGVVSALSASSGGVLVGGYFHIVGGLPRDNIAAFDAASGEWIDAFDASNSPNGAVSTLLVNGSRLYLGGSFSRLGPTTAPYIGAVSTVDYTVQPFAWPAVGTVSALAIGPAGLVAGGDIYMPFYGDYDIVGRLDPTTGALALWHPKVSIPSWSNPAPVLAIAAPDSTVFVGGTFTSVGGQLHPYFAAISASTGQIRAWSPPVGYWVWALLVDGGRLYLGGDLGTVGGQPRTGLAAVNVATGQVLDWNPQAGEVYSLAAGPGVIYAGGHMTQAGGQPRAGLAAIDAATGLATNWNAPIAGDVHALALVGDRLWVGGTFLDAMGAPRANLAVLSANTVSVGPGPAPKAGLFLTAAPNPFRSQVSATFSLARAGVVAFEVLDVNGRRVWSAPHESLPAGRHTLAWNGRTEEGRSASAGLYFLRVRSGNLTATQRVVRLN